LKGIRNFAFLMITAFNVLVISSRFAGGIPMGVDSTSHLSKTLFMYNSYKVDGKFPLWYPDWYGGTPFLLFYSPMSYLLVFFVSILGVDPVFAYKWVDSFFYLLAPFTVYFLARKLHFNEIEGISASLLFSISPMVVSNFIFYDRFPTVVALPLACLFLAFFVSSLEYGRRRDYALSAIFAGILVLTHHLSAYCTGVIAIVFLVVYYLTQKNLRGVSYTVAATLIGAFLVSAVWLIPFILTIGQLSENPFYNRSNMFPFVELGQFSGFILSITIFQFILAIYAIVLFARKTMSNGERRLLGFFTLLFFLSTLFYRLGFLYVGEAFVLLSLTSILGIFVIHIKSVEAKKNPALTACIFCFLILFWISLGYQGAIFPFLPGAKQLDLWRFWLYLIIPVAILSGKVLNDVVKGENIARKLHLPARVHTSKGAAVLVTSILLLIISFSVFVVATEVYNVYDYKKLKNTHIPREVINYFKSQPVYARILPINCSYWIYVLPEYTGKPIIDGWYPQEKLLRPLLEINDYRINHLEEIKRENGTKVQLDIWKGLILNASSLGINWVMIGNVSTAMRRYLMDDTNFEVGPTIFYDGANVTIYNSKTPVSLVDISPVTAADKVTMTHTSPDSITIDIEDLKENVTITIKEAYFQGWKATTIDGSIGITKDQNGFMVIQIKPGTSRVELNYQPSYSSLSFLIISLATFFGLILVAAFSKETKKIPPSSKSILPLGEKKVAVLIPTYNERSNITELIPRIEDVFKRNKINGHIIIVDDSSPDGTADVAEDYAKQYGNITVIRRPEKLGLGAAYLDAFKVALASKMDVIVEMDADLSHNPEYLPNFLSKIEEGYDVVVGSRYIQGGGTENWPLKRRIISRGASWVARNLLGLRVEDVTSGYRAFTSNALKNLDLASIKSSGYAFQAEVLYHCKERGIKMGETPIVFVDRKFGKSKLGGREIKEFALRVLSIFFKRIKGIFT